MQKTILGLAVISAMGACDQVEEAAGTNTSETLARMTTELAEVTSEGVDKTYGSELAVTSELQREGLLRGRFYIGSTDTSDNNVLTAYLIFEKDFEKEIIIKVIDQKGTEYGRVNQLLTGKKGQAKYFDFVFDRRTQIKSKSMFFLE
jgi:hypothetical protein